ncbi:chaoptin-like isoform X2 [Anthonomus grandis grandis]|uniref:chaoptin-like isoform X2 n=1 Tax=Anthonomus grandis grandis TaxID=2921223 RepID=UPI002165EDAE|nr:chaoptin-like isoform X2 [Anthonomus grandis grandis]
MLPFVLIKSGTMWLLWFILYLSAVFCDDLEVSPCIFNSMCSCSQDQLNPNPSIDSIACFSVPFYRFPTMPTKQIDRIEIFDSKIHSLETESLGLCEIQALVFNNNKLQYISDRVFSSSLDTLVSLDLSYNQLGGIPFQAFKELKNLHWLNLHGNQISSTNGDWSYMKLSLNTLFVGQNDLTEIADTSSTSPHGSHSGIRQLKYLTWLNADANRIHKIHKHSLPASLKTVSLSYNLIENFPLDVIASMPHLEWLYLRGNHIKTIPDYTFAKKFWIQKIDLNQNYLKYLPTKPFNGSIFVRDMFLGSNEFETVTTNSFEGLDCRRIIFAYNRIERIEDEAFYGVLNSLEYLDLDHNRLKAIPLAISQLFALRFLYLSFNYISEISVGSLENFQESLKALTLSGNRLTKTPVEAIQNCTKITYFNIASNQINEINQGDFLYWGSTVQIFNINNNRITSLGNKIFEDMPKLRELCLSYNPIRTIDPEAFYGLDNLETLELSSSFERDDLPYEAFKTLDNLKHLFLDHNNLHEIKSNSFDSLLELSYLNLESNKIEAIPATLFKSGIHSKLGNVVLSNNELNTLETGTFQHLENLEVVWLTGNKIRHLEIESFSNLSALNAVFLSNNEISSVSVGAFSHLRALKQLDMQFNMLRKFSFGQFVNLESPLLLNLSHNNLISCSSGGQQLKLDVLDLRFNKFTEVPKCLEYVSFLKKLYLNFNEITDLKYSSFQKLTSLEELSLHQNSISTIDRRAFFGLQSLQTLDLSKNAIDNLQNLRFSDMPKLRILKLKENGLTYLQREIFVGTQLEFLDISYNSFSIVPKECLLEVGNTLRHLSLQSNNLEHIDVTSFPDMPYLNYLDLSKNRLTILPDNVFTQLSLLQYLNLGFNPIRANFKELFHYAQNLRHLNLANTGLTSTPIFPLSDLVYLNLSYNNLQNINKNSFQMLSRLKYLDLSHCNLNYIPSHLWVHLANLKDLDLSHNPIKEITVDSFHGLKYLQVLNIQYLKRLSRFEGKSLVQLRILSDLYLQTAPIVDNFYDELCYVLSHMNQLRRLKINFIEHRLQDQLSCLSNKKLVYLEISGRNLQVIEREAFSKLTKNPSLNIKISGTQITELPSGLFSNMHQIQHLSIDLTNNMLTILTPETFYGNLSTWDDIGTGLVSGTYISRN